MGLLPDSYYQTNTPTPSVVTPPAPALPTPPSPVAAPAVVQSSPSGQTTPDPDTATPDVGAIPAAENAAADAYAKPFLKDQSEVLSNKSLDEQTKEFGGPVGSQQYYDYLANHPISSFFGRGVLEAGGVHLPDQETWDKMSFGQKSVAAVDGGIAAAGGMIIRAPRAVLVTAPLTLGTSIVKPWVSLVKSAASDPAGFISQTVNGFGIQAKEVGQQYAKEATDVMKGRVGFWDALNGSQLWKPLLDKFVDEPIQSEAANEHMLQLPWAGKVPTYWQNFDQARKSGLGPVAASVALLGQAAGDISITASLGEAVAGAFTPKTKLVDGQPIQNVEQIKQAAGVEQSSESTAEYYRLPKDVAKQYGGGENNTYLKVTPADMAGGTEVAVVQTRGGMFQRASDVLRKGAVYQGDFGPEVKLNSQIISAGDSSAAAGLPPGGSAAAEVSPETTDFVKELDSMKASGASDEDFAAMLKAEQNPPTPATQEPFANITQGDEVDRPQIIQDYINKNFPESSHAQDILDQPQDFSQPVSGKTPLTDEAKTNAINSIITKPLKGFENAPITADQIDHLGQIAEVRKLPQDIQNAVIRNVTGKNTIGELTQAEYVKVSQTLAAFGENNAVIPKSTSNFVNPLAQEVSPVRRFFRNVEQTSGYPVYTKGYVPMEDAAQLQKNFIAVSDAEAQDAFGKYAGPQYAEERRLVSHYIEGDTSVIDENSTLNDATKQELRDVASKVQEHLAQSAEKFGVDTSRFGKAYQSHIQNLGGVYTLYKDGSEIPNALNFFAEHYRTDAPMTRVDDALALWQIYDRAGSKQLFFDPALEQVQEAYASAPANVQAALKSYTLEKLGYAGKLEQALNDMVPGVNEKLGLSLPPDAARKLTQYVMDTTYSAALGIRPDAFVRRSLGSLYSYIRQGPSFFSDALTKAMTPEGMDEFRDTGLAVELGVPYGEELTKETTVAGQAGTYYRNVTQGALAPYASADTFSRAVTYWQSKLQWNDAVAQYNAGKISWNELEDKLDFNALHPLDQNIIRQRLIDGDQAGAFNQYSRDIIDEVNHPYRRAASGEAFYGQAGKIGGQFLQYPIEFSHMLGNWIKTGQWDKIIRFYAVAAGIKRTADDTFGIDTSKWVGLNPLDPALPPVLKAVGDLGSMVGASIQNNAQDFSKGWDDLKNEITTLGIPAGLTVQRLNSFVQSMTLSRKDNLPLDKIGIYDSRGRLSDIVPLKDAFLKLLGFTSTDRANTANTTQDMLNAQFNYSEQKKNVLELYRQGKFDQANTIIQNYGIKITPQDFDAYYIPFDQRTFKALPPSIKPQFTSQVYPQTAPQAQP